MNSLPTKLPAMVRGRVSCGRVLLVGLGLAIGALAGGTVAAQQYSATQPTGQTTGQTPGQASGQVDLLATVQNDDSASLPPTNSSPTITSIDEAVQAISVTADNASNASLTDNATEAAPVTIAVSPVADNASDAAELVPAPAPTSTLVTTSPSGGASLQKADAPSFGIVDIGVDPASGDASTLTATIWRGTPVERAAMLLDSKAVIGSSPALSWLASDVVARRTVRPEGASEADQDLLSSRLDWLAAAGRSEDLAVMVDQLPNEAPWLAWKQWLVETQLMTRRDADACRNVMYQAGRTFEPFWHKAKVICTAVHKGDIAGAQFAADILFAMGVDDPAFAGLVGKLLNDTDPGPIDPALIDQLHIVLMEAAHHDIDVVGLEALPESSTQTAVGLRYLDPDARLVATWRALRHGLIDHERAAKLWRSAAVETDPPMLALARHQSQPSALTRALVWRALDAEKSAERLAFIAAAMDVDIADGSGWMMAPLYAELAREALGFNGAEALLSDKDGALRNKLAILIGVGDRADMPDILAGGQASAARDLLAMAQTGRVDMTALAILGKYSLLPLAVSGDGMAAMQPGEAVSWLVAASPGAIRTETFLSTSPIMLQAVDEAAAAGRVAETILLAHRAVGTHSLAEMNPADVARIAAALDAVDQPEAARRFRRDVVAAHLLAAMHAQPLDLPPVTAAMPAQFPENTSGTIAGSPGSVTSQITEDQNDGDQNDGDQNDGEQNDGEQDNDVDGTLTPASGSAAVPTTPQQSDDSNL
jgi:hypothetical protein